jgi:ABC-type Mn/Zn transport systems, ATPase component
MNLNKIALSVQHLSLYYGKTPALWDVTFDIPKGTLVAIVGPNGAGKSSLIKSCLKLLPTASGSVSFFGLPLEKVRKKIAYVPQRESVDWDFPITVFDLVLMGSYNRLSLFKFPSMKEKEEARKVLEITGLSAYADRQIGQLSGGQQQRAFIARALLQDADIYFLDEPFNGIDQATQLHLIEILKELKGRGKTILIVQHDLKSVHGLFDWVILLNRSLIACGSVEQTFTHAHLENAYGKHFDLLNQALELKGQQKRGW